MANCDKHSVLNMASTCLNKYDVSNFSCTALTGLYRIGPSVCLMNNDEKRGVVLYSRNRQAQGEYYRGRQKTFLC